MAPEMFYGAYDEGSDVWSLGVIVFILLIGYPPFDHDIHACRAQIQAGAMQVARPKSWRVPIRVSWRLCHPSHLLKI